MTDNRLETFQELYEEIEAAEKVEFEEWMIIQNMESDKLKFQEGVNLKNILSFGGGVNSVTIEKYLKSLRAPWYKRLINWFKYTILKRT